jgi:DNA invertase Pin-like site-specific DNA recombinase
MDINKIIMKAGSQSELARMLGVERGAVWLWKRNGVIPKSRLWQIQLHFPELLKDKP